MPVEEPTFDWLETSEAISVRLPAPPAAKLPAGCAAAFVVTVAAVAVPLVVVAISSIADAPTNVSVWLGHGLSVIVSGCVLAYTLHLFRDARLPPRAVEPTVLSVANGVLKIERGGRERDMDYSWEVTEIADIRICAAAPEGAYFGAKVLLAHALAPDELIRISVERPTGEVDDVFVIAPGRYWTDALEVRLRAHLGLASNSRAEVA